MRIYFILHALISLKYVDVKVFVVQTLQICNFEEKIYRVDPLNLNVIDFLGMNVTYLVYV